MHINLDSLEHYFTFFDFYLIRLIDYKLKKNQFSLLKKKNKKIQGSKSFKEINNNWKNFEKDLSKLISNQKIDENKISNLNEKLEEKKILCFEENFSESEINSCIAIEKEFYYSSLKNIYHSI